MKKSFKGRTIEEIEKNLPEVKWESNKTNVEIFDEYETSNSSELRHVCILCGSSTSIDNSISCRGYKLIDIKCVYKYFDGDYSMVFDWNVR